MRLDVYDFDHTLYDGDTIVDFWLFSIRRHPALLRYLPRQLWALIRKGLQLTDTRGAKDGFQCYFEGIELSSEARAFWRSERARKKLYDWHRSRPDDLPRVIASASARLVLEPIAEYLKADAIIATEVEPSTGKLLGPNCRGARKIEVMTERFPGFSIRAMYTDDVKADGPLLALAEEKYVARKGKVTRLS